MSSQLSADREALERDLAEYLLRAREGDVRRIVVRILRRHDFYDDLVGLRDSGREALYFVRPSSCEDRLDVFDVADDGTHSVGGTLWADGDEAQLRAWLEDHRESLDWVQPEYR